MPRRSRHPRPCSRLEQSERLKIETIQLASGRSQQIVRVGAGPDLVWLHGLHGVPAHDPFVAELAKRFSVIAPIAPGFNDLAELDDIRDVHDLALHYDDILTALKLDRVCVIGHSFGAMIAAELAAHVPARVARLALLSPIGVWRDDHPVADLFGRPYTTIDKLIWAGGTPIGKMGVRDASAGPVESLVTLARGMTVVAKFLWPLPDKGLHRRLYRITSPSLVMSGAKDPLVPRSYAEVFRAGMHGAKAIEIAGAGHMLPYEQTDVVCKDLLPFMQTD
ncbi:MAG: alpha/beta hydrolase [Betaproteobacteria bacterium]|nr:alpha/beta hydrolase [Betaproteobacteria bacterium]